MFQAGAWVCMQPAQAGESWVCLKTHLGSPFWLEPGEKVARDEGELQPDVRSSTGCFFQFLKLFPALLLDLHRSLCLEHSSSAPLSGLKRSVTFFQNRSLFFFTSTPHSLCIAIKFVYMAFVCLPYETLSSPRAWSCLPCSSCLSCI